MTRTSNEVPAREHNEDRMRRAFSWLEKSNKTDNPHEKFIFLWIAFNAAYGAETIGAKVYTSRVPETDRFKKFLREILRRDEKKEIESMIWNEDFSEPIRVLLDNQYVFRQFWDFVQGEKTEKEWEKSFQLYNRRVKRYLEKAKPVPVTWHTKHNRRVKNNLAGRSHVNTVGALLEEIFYRLYTLRNQIFHGGTTFADGWGKSQLRDGSRIMASLVPIILNIMQADISQNPDSEVWGRVAYPRINQEPEN